MHSSRSIILTWALDIQAIVATSLPSWNWGELMNTIRFKHHENEAQANSSNAYLLALQSHCSVQSLSSASQTTCISSLDNTALIISQQNLSKDLQHSNGSRVVGCNRFKILDKDYSCSNLPFRSFMHAWNPQVWQFAMQAAGFERFFQSWVCVSAYPWLLCSSRSSHLLLWTSSSALYACKDTCIREACSAQCKAQAVHKWSRKSKVYVMAWFSTSNVSKRWGWSP